VAYGCCPVDEKSLGVQRRTVPQRPTGIAVASRSLNVHHPSRVEYSLTRVSKQVTRVTQWRTQDGSVSNLDLVLVSLFRTHLFLHLSLLSLLTHHSSSSITPSFFHFRLKTYLLHKSILP